MFLVCWSAKGGVGTTVVAAALAVVASRRLPVVAADLGGDLLATFGIDRPPGPGIDAWLEAPSAPGAALLRLGTPVHDDLRVVHRGTWPPQPLPPEAWQRLAAAWAAAPQLIVVDAGREIPPPDVCAQAAGSLLIVRQCYLALHNATQCSRRATGVIIVTEPGRALHRDSVVHALHRPVIAEVPWDPAIARAVDAGILTTRMPLGLSRALTRVLSISIDSAWAAA